MSELKWRHDAPLRASVPTSSYFARELHKNSASALTKPNMVRGDITFILKVG